MSDQIKHECGIALIRLKKPLKFYIEKYGTAAYGLNMLYLLMEKQHNRGQDGAGVANIKLDMTPGDRYISRIRSNSNQPIKEIFEKINGRLQEVQEENPELLKDVDYLKKNVGFTGEVLLGHLRYGTFGRNSIESCHPFLRQNNWMTRNLVVAGNFNLTNVDELFDLLVDLGQHPKEQSDTVTVLEKIGHFLDMENQKLYKKYKQLGYAKKEISDLIAKNMKVHKILKNASTDWDGGYTMAGMIGHGDAFVLRDPSGIRPAFYFENDEVVVVTSERPAIQTAFNVSTEEVHELEPGQAIIVKKNGEVKFKQIKEPLDKKACSFERIYFSRGSDQDIYEERKELGRSIVPAILKGIDNDVKNSVFSFIPNTAETSYYGMVHGIESYLNVVKKKKILELSETTAEKLDKILDIRPRVEKIAIKDAKLRTFITQDEARDDLVTHIYDITYGTVNKGVDNLVVIDDSIVRGTTLKQSIFRILDRLGPKKIIIASSAPQIRYPDCYGIDMAKLGDFIAFSATIELLKDTGREKLINEVYKKCKAQENLPKTEIRNYVKEIYAPFTAEQISAKISEMLKPKGINADVQIIYQTIEGLHKAIPNHKGDWYFTGDYPTPGGMKVVNKSFIYYFEGRNERAY
ncbi:amidophosphoribosyltransferase [Vicingaceae bacterium]|nr:amidophosphoribosyltransferase [Vicingaceae bacterium]MDB4060807.1 amidophosphoribosyltransferase [Vicingaceae bacterium]